MAEIIKIDEDTYKVIDTTEEIISLSELEQQLLDIKSNNLEVFRLEALIYIIPEELKIYLTIPKYIDTTELELKINKFKSI